MITIASLMLLSVVILTINRNFLTTNSSLITNKQTLNATSIATSIIEEATGKAYDENTLTTVNTVTPSIFSNVLGPESEKYTDSNGTSFYDDFDDYNGLYDTVKVPGSGFYEFWVKVEYANDNLVATSTKQFNKILTVKVTNSGMQSKYFDNNEKSDTVTMSALYSYWF